MTQLPTATKTRTAPEAERRASWPHRLTRGGERYGLLILAIGVAVLFSLLPASSSTFLTLANWQAILGDISVVAILAIAEIFPLIGGRFDFTIGAVCGVSAVVTATTMSRFHGPLWLAIIFGIFAGTIVGLVNAVLVARFRLNAFIVTLGGATLLSGVVQWYTKGTDIVAGLDPALGNFGSSQWFDIPRPAYLVVIVAAGAFYVLRSTPYGRQLRAVGSNSRAAGLVGIAVDRSVFVSFVLSGTLAGVAGVILTTRNGGAVAGAGPDQLFPALAAVFLGATAIDTGRYNVIGTIIGVLFVAESVSGLTLAGAASWVPDVFNGGALVVAIAVSTLLGRQRTAGITPG